MGCDYIYYIYIYIYILLYIVGRGDCLMHHKGLQLFIYVGAPY